MQGSLAPVEMDWFDVGYDICLPSLVVSHLLPLDMEAPFCRQTGSEIRRVFHVAGRFEIAVSTTLRRIAVFLGARNNNHLPKHQEWLEEPTGQP